MAFAHDSMSINQAVAAHSSDAALGAESVVVVLGSLRVGEPAPAVSRMGQGWYGTWESYLGRIALVAPWLWLIGTPLSLLLVSCGFAGACRLRRSSQVLQAPWIVELADQLSRALNLGRDVAVGINEKVASPALIGVIKPMILLPPALIGGCTTEQLEMVLLHELAHVRRWDPWVNLFQQIAEGLLFFHPAVWILSRWIRIERECCCDDVVLQQTGAPQTYAETLAYLAMPDGFSLVPSLALARHPLVGRIQRILQWQDHGLAFSPLLFVCLMLVFLTSLAMAIGVTRDQTELTTNTKQAAQKEIRPDTPALVGQDQATGLSTRGDPCSMSVQELSPLSVSASELNATNAHSNIELHGETVPPRSPDIFLIRTVTATASSSQDDRIMGPEKTVDGSGLDELDRHSTNARHMWLSSQGDRSVWIKYAFDRVYVLHEMHVWNSNQLVESFVGLGAKEVTVETSVDGEDWAKLEDVSQFAQATGKADCGASTIVEFGARVARYVRLRIHDGWGMMPQCGLSEVRFFCTGRASYPIQVLDDFEQYDDNSKRIFFAWQDGLGHSGGADVENCDEPAYAGNGGGAIVGRDKPPFAEKTIVKSGKQSMPVKYNNAFGTSEIMLALDGQDWYAMGADTLSLAFRGAADNTGELFVKINDTKLAYDGDPENVALAQWQTWTIDLASVTSDLASVTTFTIGVDGAKATGSLYIDDICLASCASATKQTGS